MKEPQKPVSEDAVTYLLEACILTLAALFPRHDGSPVFVVALLQQPTGDLLNAMVPFPGPARNVIGLQSMFNRGRLEILQRVQARAIERLTETYALGGAAIEVPDELSAEVSRRAREAHLNYVERAIQGLDQPSAPQQLPATSGFWATVTKLLGWQLRRL